MKTFSLLPFAILAAFALATNLHSQTPLPAPTATQQLQAIKAKNLEIIEKQAATLLKLEQLEKDSEQIKAFSKRS